MRYMRISLSIPRPGDEQEVARLTDQLLSEYAKQPGFVSGYKVRAVDGTGQIGRVTVWESSEHADATAQLDRVLALRSELQPLIQEDSHIEPSFEALDASEPLAV